MSDHKDESRDDLPADGLLGGDLSAVSLPRDLEAVRAAAIDAFERGVAADALFAALAREEPLALLELVAGAKAIKRPESVRAALPHASSIEGHMSPAGLYQGLVNASSESALDVLRLAAERFPAAGWVVRLSAKIEETPGLAHLAATEGHQAFEAICWAHARSGHFDALEQAAGRGQAAAAAALLAAGEPTRALDAAVAALSSRADSPVVSYFVAVAGPTASPLLESLIERLQDGGLDDAVRAATRAQLAPLPELQARLPAS